MCLYIYTVDQGAPLGGNHVIRCVSSIRTQHRGIVFQNRNIQDGMHVCFQIHSKLILIILDLALFWDSLDSFSYIFAPWSTFELFRVPFEDRPNKLPNQKPQKERAGTILLKMVCPGAA